MTKDRESMALRGFCHCDTVTWSFQPLPASATACNCTVCRRYGALWAYGFEDKGVRVAGSTMVYTRGPSIEFHFCPSCGCVAYWRGLQLRDDGRRRLAVNLRLTDPGPLAQLPVRHFDGLDSFEEQSGAARCVGELWC